MLTVIIYFADVPITEMLMSCCWYFDIGDSKVERVFAPVTPPARPLRPAPAGAG